MIDQNKLVYLIDRVLSSKGQKLKKQNEYMYWSPFVSHHKPKLQINIITQKWHCWISNQGGHKLYQLFKKVNATHEQLTELRGIVGESKSLSSNLEKVKEKVCVLPKEFLSLHHSHNSTTYKHAIFYLNKRGITKEDILKYGIGYCEDGLYSGRIIVPSYNSSGDLNYFVGRSFYDTKLKYKNPPVSKDIVGFELFVNWDEPIVLVEGVFDAIAIKRNAIPLFGKTIPKSLEMKIVENNVRNIYISLDNDALTDALKICERFMKQGRNVYMIDIPNGKDPSSIGFKNFHNKLVDTQELDFSTLMKYRLFSI